MRIAQIAPLFESVPPKCYGGTERVVSYLTEELVRQGHDVTLFASGDSITTAHLIAACPEALRLSTNGENPYLDHLLMLEQVTQNAGQYDVLHFHTDFLHFSLARHLSTPHITTLHGRLDLPQLKRLYKEFQEIPLVSISENQRKPIPQAGWTGTVYHGLPENLYTFRETPGSYLAFIGRISPEKRVDRAIEIADRTGIPLRIAAKVDPVDQKYFRKTIEPMLDNPLVEYIGEIGEKEKNEFLGNALVLLFPIDWPEPFGLVMIEAMACGTPVIAFRNGSVPEIVKDGENGFIVDSVDDAVRAVEQVARLRRKRIRYIFEQQFTASRMATDYLKIYARLAGSHVVAA
jgi:glycosyltransferase involved in cell wall biosynthesis